MAKKAPRGLWRVKDIETGLYYSRKWTQKPKEECTQNELNSIQVQIHNVVYLHWNEYGDVWTNKGSAERIVTQLTHTFKHKRDTDAKIVLYGNKDTARIRVVECNVTDKE